jgi:hypothetical protein
MYVRHDSLFIIPSCEQTIRASAIASHIDAIQCEAKKTSSKTSMRVDSVKRTHSIAMTNELGAVKQFCS